MTELTGQIEQVLINLLKNAMDALKETSEPVIDLEAFRTREGGMVLRVCDNGQGISKENLDQIFVLYLVFCYYLSDL